MKKPFVSAFLVLVMAAISVSAQAPDVAEDQQLLALVKEVQAQQAQIADNQTKIESQLADLTETIRVARIFAGKAGK